MPTTSVARYQHCPGAEECRLQVTGGSEATYGIPAQPYSTIAGATAPMMKVYDLSVPGVKPSDAG